MIVMNKYCTYMYYHFIFLNNGISFMMFLVFKSVRDKSCRKKKLRYIKPMLKGNFVSKYCKIKIKSVLINVSNITLKYTTL